MTMYKKVNWTELLEESYNEDLNISIEAWVKLVRYFKTGGINYLKYKNSDQFKLALI